MNSIQDKLQVLKNNYRENLGSKVVELSSLFEQAIDDWDPDQLGNLYRMVHSIKGSSATFGFNRLSQSAANLEGALMDVISRDAPPMDKALDELVDFYETLSLRLRDPEIALPSKQETPPAPEPVHQSPTVLSTDRLTILLTDDEEFGREQVCLMLEEAGHNVILATTGTEAIMMYEQYHPDLIIMDVVMPEMNGYEAAREIKSRSGEHFIPIIFLTALSDDNELVMCIENGGDDFLIKPVNPAILHARIYAMQRISELNNRLFEYQARTEDELTLAKHIFEKVTTRGTERHERLSYVNEPAGHFSGDILIHTEVEAGRYYILLGDFTGHGLTAAIGAIPASDIFHTMAKKNAPIHVIAEEINKKLSNLLPVSHFLAATLISVDFRDNSFSILNCGLPNAYLFNLAGEVQQEYKSNNLALGILPSNSYKESVVHTQVKETGYRLLAASDGLIEAHNPEGDLYGLERLFEAVKTSEPTDFVGSIRQDLGQFMQGHTQLDDITIMGISF
ncbi:MAG: SpoIIE family protein phosphatase [Gammaproteobacteria bacterium]|nr:SpoIIE family protein phosphatase [Gammaproteobacteria bacterium]